MKKIFPFFVMVFTSISMDTFAQKFSLTPIGLTDSEDNSKNYVVIDIPGKSAKELYDKSINYIKETYKNPNLVISTGIDNEYLRFDTYTQFLIKKPVLIDCSYTIEQRYKDGKIRVELIKCELINPLYWRDNLSLCLFKTKDVRILKTSTFYFFEDEGKKIKNPEAKASFEDHFNKYLNDLKSYIVKEKIDW